jgi:hypothetical protein
MNRHQADVRVARADAAHLGGYPCVMANASWLVVPAPFAGISTDHKPGPRQPLLS